MSNRARRLLCLVTLLITVGLLALPFPASRAAPQPGGPTRTSSERLELKRYVAAGDRACVIGAQSGGFPPMGWHIRGEMGGVWAHPIKLLDGYWFSLNRTWLTAAAEFTAGAGYVQFRFPAVDQIEVTRTEFSPDGSAIVLVGLTLHNSDSRPRVARLTMVARSEVMAAYPWGWSQPQDAKEFNGKDSGDFDPVSHTLLFTEPGKPWYAVIGSTPQPRTGMVSDDIWGPIEPAERDDYLEYGNGTGGSLRWIVPLQAGEETTLWIGIAGSHRSEAEARDALAGGLADPEGLLHEKVEERLALLAQTRVSLPDPALQAAFDWAKLNLADLRRTATDLQIRDVDEGRGYPDPVGTLPEVSGIGAGYPDYPWFFGTDGAYTAYALLVSGQWETAKAHLRTIRDASRALNGDTGKVIHELVTDGSIYFGAVDDPGNTNETAQFANAVALVWLWTGDDAFRDEMYDFVKDGLTYVTSTLDQDSDLWPEGNGMVERPGMGSEKLDVAVYTWQALKGLQRMAMSKGDTETAAWAAERIASIESAFDAAWWMPTESLYADSLCNPGDEVPPEEREANGWTNVCVEAGQQLQQRHWINATPMETVAAPVERAHDALDRLESDIFTGDSGLFHTGIGGGPAEQGELRVWTLPNSVMAVAEANYGRLGDEQALFCMRAIAGTLDLEMPGALPEILPSPEYDPFVDFRERAMFMQAWSAYGLQWPVIHHFLGIRPDVPAGHLYVVPQVPESWPGLSVEALKVGSGEVSASAARQDGQYTTTVCAPDGWTLTIGYTLPAGASPTSVTLDGTPASYEVVPTSRGNEVRVETTTGPCRTLVVTTG